MYVLHKVGHTTPRSFLFLPIALGLWPLVAHNLWLRRLGILPDEWYWADRLLYRNGYVVEWRQ